MTILEHGNKLAWPCHVAYWLPTPITKPEKPSTLLVAAAASKVSAPGNWLISESKHGEVITIEVLRDAPPLLKIFCEGGRLLLSTLSLHTFSFALVREVLLVASVINPGAGSAYTFGCRFICHQHAVECAAVMKAAISLATKLPPISEENKLIHALSSNHQQRAELLLLEIIARGDPEGAGAAWWQDFPQLLEELDQSWRSIQQPAAFRK